MSFVHMRKMRRITKMTEQNKKEVYFADYCKKCKHTKLQGNEDPCDECLEQNWNENSHKPIKFEPKEG